MKPIKPLKALLACVLLLGCALPALAQREEPSTAAERARLVRLVRQLESDPLGSDAAAGQQWIVKWIRDVPDINVSICELLPLEQSYAYAPALMAQMVGENAAFQIQNPDRAQDEVAVQGAALKGALRAYSAILRKKPAARVVAMDRLVQQMNDGSLDKRMKAYVAQRCEAADNGADDGSII